MPAWQVWFEKVQADLNIDQSIFSLIIGALIVLVLGVLVFKFFNSSSQVGPSQETVSPQNQPTADVSPDNLPGNYTVKDGDTLFKIAQAYYNDGYQYQKIADENKLTDVNNITVGQVLVIPKMETASSSPAMTASPTDVMASPSSSPLDMTTTPAGQPQDTEWGTAVNGSTYTVQAGDWLSKIAGRAYGDIYAFDKIAKANNISDPNNLEPGTVLQIPR